jgi:hypothetical protein
MRTPSVRRLVLDLAFDGACTAAQAARNRGRQALVSAAEGGLVVVRTYPYRLTGGARGRVPVPVVLLSGAGEELARREEGVFPYRPPERELAHAIGVSELRAALGLDPAGGVRGDVLKAMWARAGGSGRGVPDALFTDGETSLALEYDHGKYTMEQAEEKLRCAYYLAERLVWGAPSRARADWLRRLGVEEVLVLSPPLVWP